MGEVCNSGYFKWLSGTLHTFWERVKPVWAAATWGGGGRHLSCMELRVGVVLLDHLPLTLLRAAGPCEWGWCRQTDNTLFCSC